MSHQKHIFLPLSSSTEAEIVSLQVVVGERVRKGSLLCSYKIGNEPNQTMKCSLVGFVREVMVKEGDVIRQGDAVLLLEEHCDHSVVAFDLCAICGLNLKSMKKEADEDRLSMLHTLPQVTVSQKEGHRLGNQDKKRLLQSRKLALIVDLDQTLVHTSVDPNIERGLPDVYGFTLYGHPCLYHCRLRPYARDFLSSISHLFEMHVFTMATKDYAHAVTQMLDPEKRLFSDRVISRDECFDPCSKVPRLRSVFPCGDEMVAIIDDREDVWGPCPNLVHVKPYVFFSGTSDINAPPHHHSRRPNSHKLSHKPLPYEEQKLATKEQSVGSGVPVTVSSSTPTSDNITNDNTNNSNNKKCHLLVDGEPSSSSSDSSSDSSSSDSSSSEESDGEEPKGKVDKKDVSKKETPMETNQVSPASDHHVNEKMTSSSSPNVEKMTTSSSSNVTQEPPSEVRKSNEPRKLKIKDPDDFLLHLAKILTRIHNTFYKEYDLKQKKRDEENRRHETMTSMTSNDIQTPDLKEIIPKLRKSVFLNKNLLFTGVIPIGIPIERSRELNTARAFGATVHTNLVHGLTSKDPEKRSKATTHLIVGRPGTNKYKQARKVSEIKIVSPRWFWNSAERWELEPEDKYSPNFLERDDGGITKMKKGIPVLEGMKVDVDKVTEKDDLMAGDKTKSLTETAQLVHLGQSTQILSDTKSETSNISLPPVEVEMKDTYADVEHRIDKSVNMDVKRQHALLRRTFSVSSEELEKMEAEVDAELASDEEDEEVENDQHGREMIGSFTEPIADEEESFDTYLGLEEPKYTISSRKRKHVEIEGSSNSTSIDEGESGESSDSSDSEDELAQLLASQ